MCAPGYNTRLLQLNIETLTKFTFNYIPVKQLFKLTYLLKIEEQHL